MKDTAGRGPGSALVELTGRLDREAADDLSDRIEALLRTGVRSLRLDLGAVTFVSSAATRVLTRWRAELALLRGQLELVAIPSAVQHGLLVTGWNPAGGPDPGVADLRRSSWHARADFARAGSYEVSACESRGTLRARLVGGPDPSGARPVAFGPRMFGLGLGTLGGGVDNGAEPGGELVAVEGCLACFPAGRRKPDYLVGGGTPPPEAVLATGIICDGGFSDLVRFSTRPDADEIPVSELAAVALETARSPLAGVVLAGETAGLVGARLLRSPRSPGVLASVALPELREWLSFAPERIHPSASVIIAGVVGRVAEGPLAGWLRPLGAPEPLSGHLHAAVFSYLALPQRTVELPVLVRRLFHEHTLRDVLHLIADDRTEDGVGESALQRGVMWVGPITAVE